MLTTQIITGGKIIWNGITKAKMRAVVQRVKSANVKVNDRGKVHFFLCR